MSVLLVSAVVIARLVFAVLVLVFFGSGGCVGDGVGGVGVGVGVGEW